LTSDPRFDVIDAPLVNGLVCTDCGTLFLFTEIYYLIDHDKKSYSPLGRCCPPCNPIKKLARKVQEKKKDD
jgi:hypothetical protein